jgi:hypothetical protein
VREISIDKSSSYLMLDSRGKGSDTDSLTERVSPASSVLRNSTDSGTLSLGFGGVNDSKGILDDDFFCFAPVGLFILSSS